MRATAFMVVLSMALLSTAAFADESATQDERAKASRTVSTDKSGISFIHDPASQGSKAEVPGLMNYQGTLTDAGSMALDTTVSMTFSIYPLSVGGTAVWTETQPAVVVSSGIFNVLLGSVNSIPDTVFKDPERWLGVQVGSDPVLEPLQRIAAVGYAFRAAEADTADFARAPAPSDGDWTITGIDMYSTVLGNVGIGAPNPLSKLTVRNLGANELQYALRLTNPDVTDTGGTATGVLFETEPNDYGKGALVYERKRNFARGDFHFLQRTTGDYSSPTLNDAVVTIKNDGYVGIGTISPAEKLDVSGNIHASGTIKSGTSITIDGVNNRVTSTANLDLNVISGRALRLEPHATSPNLIGGYSGNSVIEGIYGATIGGGGNSGSINSITGNYSTVGGGQGNTASSDRAFVGGGQDNTASSSFATVGGGWGNEASSPYAAVGGGSNNDASGQYAAVGGGRQNAASGNSAIVAGGSQNAAGGDYSFAAGRRAKANHSGAFVWGDYTDADFASTGANQFLIRASGGVGIGTTSPLAKLDVAGAVNVDSAYAYKLNGEAVLSAPSGWSNIVVGAYAGVSMTSGYSNTFVGNQAGHDNNEGDFNTFIGAEAGFFSTTSHRNTYIGYGAGRQSSNAGYNTYLGFRSGYNSTGQYNVFLGYNAGFDATGSNKLYIANGPDTSDVLVYGDFSTGKVGLGTLAPAEILHLNKSSGSLGMRISSDVSSYQYINMGATNGYGIGCDANDRFFLNREQPLGTGVLRILTIPSSGNVGIGTTSPARPLHVNDVIRLEPRVDFPSSASDGDLCVKGTAGSRHIYCYLNGDWRQLD